MLGFALLQTTQDVPCYCTSGEINNVAGKTWSELPLDRPGTVGIRNHQNPLSDNSCGQGLAQAQWLPQPRIRTKARTQASFFKLHLLDAGSTASQLLASFWSLSAGQSCALKLQDRLSMSSAWGCFGCQPLRDGLQTQPRLGNPQRILAPGGGQQLPDTPSNVRVPGYRACARVLCCLKIPGKPHHRQRHQLPRNPSLGQWWTQLYKNLCADVNIKIRF